jgi:hypothetical protein
MRDKSRYGLSKYRDVLTTGITFREFLEREMSGHKIGVGWQWLIRKVDAFSLPRRKPREVGKGAEEDVIENGNHRLSGMN